MLSLGVPVTLTAHVLELDSVRISKYRWIISLVLIRLLLGQIKKAISYTNQVDSYFTPTSLRLKKKWLSKIKKHTIPRKIKAVIKSEAPKDDSNVGNNSDYNKGESNQILPNFLPAILGLNLN